MNAALFASLLAAVAVIVIVLLTILIVSITFPDRYGLYHVRIAWEYLGESGDQTVILAAKGDWETLEETLWLDAQSHMFDEDLRQEIDAALGNLLVYSR